MTKPIIYIMGISGSGKSTIGRMLSEQTGIPFFDADDFHPSMNVEKMQAGIPLEDEDRIDWLEQVANKAHEESKNEGAIFACSALKEKYRKALIRESENVKWVYLHGSEELIRQRIKLRSNHFMPAELIQSQILALEEPEYGLHINVQQKREKIVEEIIENYHL